MTEPITAADQQHFDRCQWLWLRMKADLDSHLLSAGGSEDFIYGAKLMMTKAQTAFEELEKHVATIK